MEDNKINHITTITYETETIYRNSEGLISAIDSGKLVYADSDNRIFEKHLDEYFVRNTHDNSMVPMIGDNGLLNYKKAYSKNVIRDLVRAIRKASLSLDLNGKTINIPEHKEFGFTEGNQLLSQWLYFIADMLED
jgi:hypothetical protein